MRDGPVSVAGERHETQEGEVVPAGVSKVTGRRRGGAEGALHGPAVHARANKRVERWEDVACSSEQRGEGNVCEACKRGER